MKPTEVYTAIQDATGEKTVVMCMLHAPCCQTRGCGKEQQTELVDFDAVKTWWCMQKGIGSCSSVDGMTATDNVLYMVELKGTREFLAHQIPQEDSLSEKEIKREHSKINKQIGKYHLQEKFLTSIGICEDIVGTSQLSSQMPIVYLLVTDVNPQRDALLGLTEQLNMLAQTSTNWERVYTEALGNHLAEEMEGLENIKSHFVFCQEFDNYIR